MSHSAAIFFDRASSSFFSPLLKRTFSNSTTSPSFSAKSPSFSAKSPSSQSRITGTSRPSNLPRCAATGFSEADSSYTPSSGRPRCDISITFAPAFIACSMVGSDAWIRTSDVTLPSLTGTFKSSRISTRLPFRSRSVMRKMDIACLCSLASSGCLLIRHRCQQIQQAVGVSPFVVIPGDQMHHVALYARLRGIDNRRFRAMNKITAHQRLGVETDQAVALFGNLFEQLVQLDLGWRLAESQRQVHQRHVQCRPADRITTDATLHPRQHFLHRANGARRGRHDVLCRGTTTSQITMHMVEQRLV